MERHTYSVNFSASPSKARKTGLMPIFVTIRQNGERVTFTTGKYIHPSEWDAVKQKARGSSQGCTEHITNVFLCPFFRAGHELP